MSCSWIFTVILYHLFLSLLSASSVTLNLIHFNESVRVCLFHRFLHVVLTCRVSVCQFYLQDTKSSNGTFINSQRLSRGSEESPPCEVLSGDIIQFGVDVTENTRKGTEYISTKKHVRIIVILIHELCHSLQRGVERMEERSGWGRTSLVFDNAHGPLK